MRAILVMLLAGVVLVLGAVPAMAHGRGSDATNFFSELTSTPDIPGTTWQIYGGDEYLALTSPDVEVLVEGYRNEPYLRIGPDGVFENQNSEATYLNTGRTLEEAEAPPPNAGPDAEPDWEQISASSTYAWHDHRIHWMSPALPQQVQAEPGQEFVVDDDWFVSLQVDGAVHRVTGSLTWVPGPSAWPWVVGALVLLAPLALLGLRTTPREEGSGDGPDGWPGLARPAAAVLGVVVLANLTHLVDDLTATPLPFSEIAWAAAQTALFIAIGGFGAWRAWQGGDGAFTALGVGAGAIFVGQGLLYASVLGASQNASVFPDFLTRAVVALSLAQVVPLIAVAVIGTRRMLPPPEPPEPVESSTAQTAA